MQFIAFILQGAALGFSAAASPGPFQAYLIAQSVRLGWRRALPVALAPLVSDGVIIALALLILTRLPGGFLRVVQIGGGAYVLWLAWKALQAYRAYRPQQAADAGAQRQSLLQAALVNFLSPGPYLFWSILGGPVLLAGWNRAPAYGAAFLAGMYGALVGCLAALIVLFGSAGQLGPRVSRILLGFSALALLAFGVYQLYQGIFVSSARL